MRHITFTWTQDGTGEGSSCSLQTAAVEEAPRCPFSFHQAGGDDRERKRERERRGGGEGRRRERDRETDDRHGSLPGTRLWSASEVQLAALFSPHISLCTLVTSPSRLVGLRKNLLLLLLLAFAEAPLTALVPLALRHLPTTLGKDKIVSVSKVKKGEKRT